MIAIMIVICDNNHYTPDQNHGYHNHNRDYDHDYNQNITMAVTSSVSLATILLSRALSKR
jgi:hypothetical protein